MSFEMLKQKTDNIRKAVKRLHNQVAFGDRDLFFIASFLGSLETDISDTCNVSSQVLDGVDPELECLGKLQQILCCYISFLNSECCAKHSSETTHKLMKLLKGGY